MALQQTMVSIIKILLLICFLFSEVSSNPLVQGSDQQLLQAERAESNQLTDVLDEFTPKVRKKRFILPSILNLGNLFVVQILGTAIRPTNLVLLKVKVSIREEEERKRRRGGR
eukprot:GFUD01128765.1.p1 GENE.GFUD01128765.1~~GFUD01128765.1.p1  ORF type:complete len:113 (+),score=23.95 GFUD01128765.1:35-373(+)